MNRGTIYLGTDGRCYGCVQVWERLEANEWKPCCWDVASGQKWVQTATDDLLALMPISPSDVPDGLEIERCEGGVVVTGHRSERENESLRRRKIDELAVPAATGSTPDRRSR